MTDVATNPAFIIFVAVSPLLIALVKQQGFSRQVNAMIAFACYVIIGIAGALFSGTALTMENAVGLVAIATVVGSAAYTLLWSNIGVNTVTPVVPQPLSIDQTITNATSIVKSPATGW